MLSMDVRPMIVTYALPGRVMGSLAVILVVATWAPPFSEILLHGFEPRKRDRGHLTAACGRGWND